MDAKGYPGGRVGFSSAAQSPSKPSPGSAIGYPVKRLAEGALTARGPGKIDAQRAAQLRKSRIAEKRAQEMREMEIFLQMEQDASFARGRG